MSDFGLKFSCRKLFFDRDIVIDAMDAATLGVLRRAGGTVRKIARRSIKKRKRSAESGKPPSSHSGLLKDFIWFSMSRDEDSVVIGPVLLNQVDELNGKFRKGTVPELLEHGGVSGVVEQQRRPGGEWTRLDKRRRANDNPKRVRRTTYAGNPFMAPALDQVTPTLPEMWRDSVK